MTIIVQKYGGTSVGDIDKIKTVINNIIKTHNTYNTVIVVVSAMNKTTDYLINLARNISHLPYDREYDMLLTTGERITMSLIALGLKKHNILTESFTGSQSGIITDEINGCAHIQNLTMNRIKKSIQTKHIPILAGFQGIAKDSKNITTLGRGGSDLTATAVAAYFKADICEIYTDTDGVYNLNPNEHQNSKRINNLSYQDIAEIVNDSEIMQLRSINYAIRHNIKLHIKSLLYKDSIGTFIMNNTQKNPFKETYTIININSIECNLAEIYIQKENIEQITILIDKLNIYHISINIIEQTLNEGYYKIRFMFLNTVADKVEEILKQTINIDIGYQFKNKIYNQLNNIKIIGSGFSTHLYPIQSILNIIKDYTIYNIIHTNTIISLLCNLNDNKNIINKIKQILN